jgi:proteasome lid subunit RPN8/RPN11
MTDIVDTLIESRTDDDSVDSLVAVVQRPVPATSRGQRLTDLIGNTPLLRFRSLEPHAGVEVYGKAEWFNPGGSVKDRAALAMIEAGERTGALTKERVILDATSGNTGIAYAMIGAARGYRVKLCVPGTASEERKKILKAYGVELVYTDPAEGSDGAIRTVRELYAADPEAYFYPDQYNNPENWRAHFRTTGAEIWQQTGGRITHFVAGLGTSDLRPARFAVQRPGGAEAHGDGHRAGHLRQRPGRHRRADRDRSRLPHGASDRPRRRRPARHLRRRGAGGCRTRCAGTGHRELGTGNGHRRHPARRRQPVSQRPLLGRGLMSEQRTAVSVQPIVLSAEQQAAIARHGEATFPDECCGAMLGRVEGERRIVERLLEIENQWDEGERRRRFLITPQQYLRLEREADRSGQALIGFYHSHPNAPARPSEFDREHALPWHSYVIASIVDGRYDVMTAWQLADDRGSFQFSAISDQ